VIAAFLCTLWRNEMNPEIIGTAPVQPSLPALYRAVWRWHFYAGVVVLPFLLVLAATGLIMLYGNAFETAFGKAYPVAPGGARQSIVAQADQARAAIPGGTTRLFVHPANDTHASVFLVNADGKDHVVSVDPHDGRVLGIVVKDDTWFYWASRLHGTLMMGDLGDRLQEIAAGLGIVLVLSGLYLWWPRSGRDWVQALVPSFRARGRVLWRRLHMTLGFYFSVLLLFFLLSGLAWTGVWGTRIMQAWSTLPAAKFDNVPLSDKTHAGMNHGAMKEVPWALEQTPMPASGSLVGRLGIPMHAAVDLDSVAAYAREVGFAEQFRINLPNGPDGVYTVSADSMDGDTRDPFGDRTLHIDRYSGKVLADIRFADYSIGGKAMAAGVAFHQGNLGPWNTILNATYCLFVIFMCISGAVLWWKRRPAGGFGAPRYPRDGRIPRAVLGIVLAVAIAFPLTGIAILAFAAIDFLGSRRAPG
jgi:uncharacterized iron-regulated membrane protein